MQVFWEGVFYLRECGEGIYVSYHVRFQAFSVCKSTEIINPYLKVF